MPAERPSVSDRLARAGARHYFFVSMPAERPSVSDVAATKYELSQGHGCQCLRRGLVSPTRNRVASYLARRGVNACGEA